MKCHDFENLLTLYMDGALDSTQIKALRRHIQACPQCAEEYTYAQKYKKTISSMAEETAPKNFLRNVHDRIEKQSSFKKVIYRLFSPFYIKIPIEAASILVTAVIIIIFLNRADIFDRLYEKDTALLSIQEEERPAVDVTRIRKTEVPQKVSKEKTPQIAANNEQLQFAQTLKKSPSTTMAPDVESEIMEKSERRKSSESIPPSSHVSSSENKDTMLAMSKSPIKKKAYTKAPSEKEAIKEKETMQTLDAVPLIDPETHEPRKEYALEGKEVPKQVLPKKEKYAETSDTEMRSTDVKSKSQPPAAPAPDRENHAAERIKSLTLLEQGEITYIQHSSQTRKIQYIILKIPYQRYDVFIKKLTRIVKISNTRPRPKPAKDGTVTLKIQFIKRK